jgi:phage-related protein
MIEDKEANKSISRTDKKAKSLGDRLTKGIKTAAKWGAGLAAGAGVAIGGMVALGSKVGDMADAILDLNSITGMSTDSIQKWRKATEVAGVAQDAVANASQKLTRNLDTMRLESNKGNKALQELGFSLSDIENMSADERMDTLTQALAGVEDKTERARLGTDIFAGSWKEIAPVVDLGTEAMNKAKDSANIISEEDLKKANDFRISIANMKDQVGFFVTEIGIQLLPMLQGMFGWVQDNMPQIKSITSATFEVMGSAVTKVSNFIRDEVIPRLQDFWSWVEPNLPMIQEFFMTSFGVMKDVLADVVEAIKATTQWFQDHWNIVEPILIGIAAGIVTFQLITAAIAAYGAITKAITAIQLLFNAALLANPIGLVVIAIGLLVAAGVALYKNWDVVKAKLGDFWRSIKSIFGKIGSFVAGVWDGMVSGVKRAVNSVIRAFNGMIRGLNRIQVDVPDWVPGFGGRGFGFNISTIPMLAEGGNITKAGRVIVGEAGPEILDLPRGARVTPLDEKDKSSDRPIYVFRTELNGRVIAEEVYEDVSELQEEDRIRDERAWGD